MALGERDEQLLYERVRQLKAEVQLVGVVSNSAGAQVGLVTTEALGDAPQKSRSSAARQQLAVALSDLGTQLKLTGKPAEARARYLEALEYNDKYPDAYYNLGVLVGEAGQLEQATEYYTQALACMPCYAEAHCNLGVIWKQRGDLQEARRHYEQALLFKPNFDLVKRNLSIVLSDVGTQVKQQGDGKAAVQLYKQSLIYDPFHADAYYNLGVVYAERKRFDRAEYCYRMALHFHPSMITALHNLGIVYKVLGNLEKAAECYLECLKHAPGFVQAINDLGMLYTMMGRHQDAIVLFERAIQLSPQYAVAYNNLGVVLRDEGKIREALLCYDKCIDLAKGTPDEFAAYHNKLLAANYDIERTWDQIQALHLDWGRRFCAHTGMLSQWANLKDKDRRLTIGYVSPDFFYHSVSYFSHNVLLNHDHTCFKVVCFSNVHRADEKTARFKELADEWHDILGKPAGEVCELVQQVGVDILVDLTGHTSGNRLDVFARKPAPVQVTWIGYPNTTGLPSVDYRFTDSVADPVDRTPAEHYSERLVRLDPCFLCYNPDTPAFYEARAHPKGPDCARLQKEKEYGLPTSPAVSPPPCTHSGFITAGTFNSISKITPRVAAAWSQILHQVPEMRILLKSKPLACPRVRADMLALFTVHGVAAERLHFVGLIANHNAHLSAYNELDIALDCWPYNGTATSCEGLYMGVPLVTLRGPHHCHNVGASLNTVLGYSELIASSEAEYVEIAVALAKDKTRLARYRSELRPRLLASPLANGASYVRNVEDLYRKMWESYCDGVQFVQPCGDGTKAALKCAPSSSVRSQPSEPSKAEEAETEGTVPSTADIHLPAVTATQNDEGAGKRCE
eukprot:RCo014713